MAPLLSPYSRPYPLPGNRSTSRQCLYHDHQLIAGNAKEHGHTDTCQGVDRIASSPLRHSSADIMEPDLWSGAL